MILTVAQESAEAPLRSSVRTAIELRHRRFPNLVAGGRVPSTAPDQSTERIGIGTQRRSRHPPPLGLEPPRHQDHGTLDLSDQLEHLGHLGLHIPKLPRDHPTGVHHHLVRNRGLDLQ